MNPTTLLRTTIFASAALLGASLSAQTITWGPVQNATAPSEVSTNGTLVAAYNLHGSNTLSTINAVVNGVTFVGGTAVDTGSRPSTWNGWNTSALSGGTTGDVEYDKLLNGSRAMADVAPASNPTAIGGIRLDHPAIATLVAGKVYEIQVWFADQRGGTGLIYDRQMELNSVVGTPTLASPGINGGEITSLAGLTVGTPSGRLDGDPNNSTAPGDTIFGSYCIGTFTYSGTETWLTVTGYHPVATQTLRPHINAYQIRETGFSGSFTYTPGGCPNSAGQPVISSTTLPKIGTVFTANVAPVPVTAAVFMVYSTNDTYWTPFGPVAGQFPFQVSAVVPWVNPACNLYVDPTYSLFLGAGAPSASWNYGIANLGWLVGLKIHMQAITLETNPNRASFSGKGTITIGQ